MKGSRWRPQRESNPRYRRERAMSWASRRWGLSARSGAAGGARRDRTADLLHAMQALSQLSYSPEKVGILGSFAPFVKVFLLFLQAFGSFVGEVTV